MTICLPLSVTIPRKTKEDKVININMNVTRNLHYHVLNQAKATWKDIVWTALDRWYAEGGADVPPFPHRFTYTVFPGTNRVFDLANVCAAIQKFTDDSLQELGIIKDDNYKHIRAVRYEFGRVDKERPRCELEISSWEA